MRPISWRKVGWATASLVVVGGLLALLILVGRAPEPPSPAKTEPDPSAAKRPSPAAQAARGPEPPTHPSTEPPAGNQVWQRAVADPDDPLAEARRLHERGEHLQARAVALRGLELDPSWGALTEMVVATSCALDEPKIARFYFNTLRTDEGRDAARAQCKTHGVELP